jgi:glycosyltransferase involved in cell wall biosynthesis
MKKVIAIVPQDAFVVGGGVKTQAEKTIHFARKAGVTIEQYHPWKEYDWDEVGAVHVFRADFETLNICRVLKERGVKIVVSPVFYSVHSASKIRMSRFFTRRVRQLFRGVKSDFDYVGEVLALADYILPNTGAEKELLQQIYDLDDSRVEVVPNGVDRFFCRADDTLFTEKYNETGVILTVGNLGAQRKNMLRFLQAVRTLDRSVYVVGPYLKCSYADQCMEIIESCDHIHWIGELSHDDPLLGSAFAAARIFALPSQFETPGIAAMEAALAGAQVVITPHGGTQEVFGTDAHYCDPKSVSSIRQAIDKALSQGYKPEKLRARLLENYSWERIGEATAQVYRKLL